MLKRLSFEVEVLTPAFVGGHEPRKLDEYTPLRPHTVRGLLRWWFRAAADAARDMARGRLSEFQPCLPEEAGDRLLSEHLLDQPGTLRFLAIVKVNGTRIAAHPHRHAPR
jgi:RAMP superfamily